MGPTPDPRWTLLVGGIGPDGAVLPMSFEVLQGLTIKWEAIVPWQPGCDGPKSLLRTARSLFAHAWFDYEFLAVACLVGFQATEAAFRELYPDLSAKPFRVLVNRACAEAVLPEAIAKVADAGVELRNLLSHPLTQAGFTFGMATNMLENQHRLVALVIAAGTGGLISHGRR